MTVVSTVAGCRCGEEEKKRNVAHRAKHHVRFSHRAGKLCRAHETDSNQFFSSPDPPSTLYPPLFFCLSQIYPRTPRSFKTKMYVPIGVEGRGARCLFVTAKRDFCGNGEKNCNRDLWSVSIDADLVFFFISNGTRALGIYSDV